MPVTLPNLLTLLRIAAIPLLVGLLYWTGAWASWAALLLFVAAAVTDWLDGYLARKYSDTSPIGRFLDPIADKLMVAAVVVMLVASQRITGLVVLPAIVILCREILVSGLREHLAEIRVPLPVSRLAKWKTTVQMIALGVLIVGEAGPAALPVRLIGEIGLWTAGGITLITGYDYLIHGLRRMQAPVSGRRAS